MKGISCLKSKKNIIMIQEVGGQYRNTIICWFCEKDIDSSEVRYHCHLKGRYIYKYK